MVYLMITNRLAVFPGQISENIGVALDLIPHVRGPATQYVMRHLPKLKPEELIQLVALDDVPFKIIQYARKILNSKFDENALDITNPRNQKILIDHFDKIQSTSAASYLYKHMDELKPHHIEIIKNTFNTTNLVQKAEQLLQDRENKQSTTEIMAENDKLSQDLESMLKDKM